MNPLGSDSKAQMWNAPVFWEFWVQPTPNKINWKARLSTADLKHMLCCSVVWGRDIRNGTSSSQGSCVWRAQDNLGLCCLQVVTFLCPQRTAQGLCSPQLSHQTCFHSVNCRFAFRQGFARGTGWCWEGCKLSSAPHRASRAREKHKVMLLTVSKWHFAFQTEVFN